MQPEGISSTQIPLSILEKIYRGSFLVLNISGRQHIYPGGSGYDRKFLAIKMYDRRFYYFLDFLIMSSIIAVVRDFGRSIG
jgi:hypothetical protein